MPGLTGHLNHTVMLDLIGHLNKPVMLDLIEHLNKPVMLSKAKNLCLNSSTSHTPPTPLPR